MAVTTGLPTGRVRDQARTTARRASVVASLLAASRRLSDNSADDYVQKPFGVGELLARLRAALRNRIARSGATPAARYGDVEIDLVTRSVSKAGEPVRLSPREYDLLAQLVMGAGKVMTHAHLLKAVWGQEFTGECSTFDRSLDICARSWRRIHPHPG